MKFNPVVAITSLGFLYLVIAGAMNDNGMPYLFVFFVGGVALGHFAIAKIIYDRRP